MNIYSMSFEEETMEILGRIMHVKYSKEQDESLRDAMRHYYLEEDNKYISQYVKDNPSEKKYRYVVAYIGEFDEADPDVNNWLFYEVLTDNEMVLSELEVQLVQRIEYKMEDLNDIIGE